MSKIQVLDCTLRDGGYCNNCRFGFDNERKIVHGLVEANIDIIECGFLMNTVEYDKDVTKFTSLDEVSKIIPQNKEGKTFVMLTDYGKYRPEDLPEYDGTSVDGLRVAFHKKDRVAALEECKAIKSKGYKVFVQAMVSLSYTDEEFLDLIHRVNELEPYAFYIVDSFGMMRRKDLTRLFYLVEHNLNENIKIGFHSHNNMQLAYSNAQSLVDLHSDRELIIDASVYGMGRGADDYQLISDGFNNETDDVKNKISEVFNGNLSIVISKNISMNQELLFNLFDEYEINENRKLLLINNSIEKYDFDSIRKCFEYISGENFNDIFMGKNPKITINDTNESILHILKSKEIVSSFKEENDYYRVYIKHRK